MTTGERTSGGADDLRLRLVVLRCQAGDDQAFATLFDWFSPKTLRHLRGLIGDAADDVQQDVWLTVYRRLAEVVNPGAFRTWLFRTTRHRAMDFLRRQRREQELVDEFTIVAGEAVVQSSDDPLPELVDDSIVDAEIARLPALQREALLLRYRNELSYTDIALIVGCPLGTVKTRVYHAKRTLQQRLKRGPL